MRPNELIARAWEHTRDGFNALARDPTGYDNARTARAVACEALHAVEDLVYALGQERGIVFPDQGSVGPPRAARFVCSSCGEEVEGGVGAQLPSDHVCKAKGPPIQIGAARALALADAVRVYLRRCMGAIPLDRLPPDDPVLALRDALADFEAGAQPSGPPRLRVHTVSEGESLSGIAYMYGIKHPNGRSYSYLVLAELNRIADPEHIEPGWKIIIPD